MTTDEDGITKYYDDKRREAKALMVELELHKQTCHAEYWNCRTCRILGKRLEMARYVGD